MGKRPSFQFYPGDWLRDTALRSCSVGARGLWIEMICLMHEGSPYGHLKVNLKPILTPNLARMAGATLPDTEGWLGELSDAGVYDLDGDGAIYSRRMVRDEEVRVKRAAGGVLGGNPALMKGKGKDNLPPNLKPTPSSASSSASSSADDKSPSSSEFLDAWNETAKEAGWKVCRSMNKARQTSLGERRQDKAWVHGWGEALAKAKLNARFGGDNDRGWKANVDWFLRPKVVDKILEGFYDDWKPEKPRGKGKGHDFPIDDLQERSA